MMGAWNDDENYNESTIYWHYNRLLKNACCPNQIFIYTYLINTYISNATKNSFIMSTPYNAQTYKKPSNNHHFHKLSSKHKQKTYT